MTEELAETPYLVIYTKGNVDNKEVKLYYLGKLGYDKLKHAASEVDVRILKNELEDLRWRIGYLEEPLRKKQAIELLQKQQGKHTGKHTYSWFANRSYPHILERDLESLVKEGKLCKEKPLYKELFLADKKRDLDGKK